ncbi:YtxH domain-containing protein [Heyndrickxia ginsengihumi]|uniref:YtxH domain-containing protein n=1 Tax=Heyndrickxia ginsengihumi TaxID=363870 RepID=A0A0A6VEI9_9BACI|nr:YtxH domain-containing protein [Heyndrickxia ginsengihumi]KHD85878.1 hypothetical protein NG54_06390 [Heyndrickxia ginsengihumi]MBE6185637.1 YtxH domain-containing protein [Bacillus sp. (in: firmicutes)]MCM3023624.1 YtxH domain-containing protein [Heyndrickxia ginsengihumi]NEY18889.1 YtxH domain-containing protein [Heyndrickxia ginsengihumi]
MKKTKLVYGFLIGSTVGAITALLTAPSSGQELRKQISEKKDDWLQDGRDILNNLKDLKESIGKLSTEGKVIVEDVLEEIKHSFQDWQRQVEPSQDAIQVEINEIQKNLADLESKIQKHND